MRKDGKAGVTGYTKDSRMGPAAREAGRCARMYHDCVISLVKISLPYVYNLKNIQYLKTERSLFRLSSGGVWLWGLNGDSLGVLSSQAGKPGLSRLHRFPRLGRPA